jgi:FMN-binding protein
MRRIIFAVCGTVAGLAMLLSFKSHTSAGAVTSAAGTSNTQPFGQASASAAASPSGGSGVLSTTGGRQLTGQVANTAYGPVQLQLTLVQNKITKVTVLQQPEATANDIRIGNFAFPELIKETLTAQSAKIDSVSGATYTSGGYIKSLQSILDGSG